jgi:RNA polymerase-interacting CarD/CdnL/TRCF family regulator
MVSQLESAGVSVWFPLMRNSIPSELAEVVRNGARRDRGLKAKGTGSQLSPSERDLYLRARRLLSSEIAWARGLDPDEADDWIEAQLAAGAS